MAEPDVEAAGCAVAGLVVFGADAAEELPELQAAAPRARVPAIAATPRNVNFMNFLLSCVGEPLRDAAAESSR
jgi:ABC-type enterochelin transport system substrate-binding protein